MTIAVIGHGRSPEGKRWGTKIDRCHTVVRMWDWSPWQQWADYGDKYDYGLFVLTPKGLSVFQSHNKTQPSRGWLAYLGKPVSGALPDKTQLVDPEPWCQLGRELGGAGLSGRLTLTRGAVAAAWAISYAPKNQPVVLVGFDNVKVGINQPVEQSFNPTYWAMFNSRWESKMEKAYPIGGAKTETHDMAIEATLLDKLATARGVELFYAEDYWNG